MMLVPGPVRIHPHSLSVAKNKEMYQMENLIFISPEVSESLLHHTEFGRCSHGKAWRDCPLQEACASYQTIIGTLVFKQTWEHIPLGMSDLREGYDLLAVLGRWSCSRLPECGFGKNLASKKKGVCVSPHAGRVCRLRVTSQRAIRHTPQSRAQWTSGRSRSTWRCPCCWRAGKSTFLHTHQSSCRDLSDWKQLNCESNSCKLPMAYGWHSATVSIAPPLRAPVTRTMLQHSISGQRMTSFYGQTVSPLLSSCRFSVPFFAAITFLSRMPPPTIVFRISSRVVELYLFLITWTLMCKTWFNIMDTEQGLLITMFS